MKSTLFTAFLVALALSIWVPPLLEGKKLNLNIFQPTAKTQEPETGTYTTRASWYSTKECTTPRNPKCLMANGKPLNDNAYTCASWDYPFGTLLRLTTLNGENVVLATVTDRGPAKRLYKSDNRTLDLSKRTFSALAPLSEGVIEVVVKKIK